MTRGKSMSGWIGSEKPATEILRCMNSLDNFYDVLELKINERKINGWKVTAREKRFTRATSTDLQRFAFLINKLHVARNVTKGIYLFDRDR